MFIGHYAYLLVIHTVIHRLHPLTHRYTLLTHRTSVLYVIITGNQVGNDAILYMLNDEQQTKSRHSIKHKGSGKMRQLAVIGKWMYQQGHSTITNVEIDTQHETTSTPPAIQWSDAKISV